MRVGAEGIWTELAHAAHFRTIIAQNKISPWSQKISDLRRVFKGTIRHQCGGCVNETNHHCPDHRCSASRSPTKSIDTREILKLEDEFGRAMMKNDPEAIGRLLADDWIIID